jgi:DNA-binding NarL/FixJ family response regulator
MIVLRMIGLSPLQGGGLSRLLSAQPGWSTADGLGPDGDDGTRSVYVVGSAGRPAALDLVAAAGGRGPVLVLADRTEPAQVEAYFAAGALGCVHSAAPLESIAEGLRAVAEGRRYLALSPARTEAADPSADRAAAAGRTPAGAVLSEREQQVLDFIGHGYTHDQIASRLRISRHTVDTYVKRVRRKLSLGNKAQLARAAVLSELSSLGAGSGPAGSSGE